MYEIQWPKLDNFIPRDLLEHTRLLRTNFTKINHYVNENPVGAVPNYCFNVLSQQYMILSEKLLAPPTEGELTALDVRIRAHVASQLAMGLQGKEDENEEVEEAEEEAEEEEEEKEREEDEEEDAEEKEETMNVGGRTEVVQDEELYQAWNESSRDRENFMYDPSSERISRTVQETAVNIPNSDLILSQPREEAVQGPNPERIPTPLQEDAAEFPNPPLFPSQPRWEAVNHPSRNVICQPEETAVVAPSFCQPQENAEDVGDPHTTRGLLQELEISSIPFDVDLQDDADGEIHVAIPALACSTSTDGAASEILLKSYGVEMQNVRTTSMSIKTEAQKFKTRKTMINENRQQRSSLRNVEDITNIEWISNDTPKKPQSAIVLEFRTPEQANEVIKIGLYWFGSTHNCRKYLRNCKPRQCAICQGYGHGESQCTSRPRCIICSGQHSPSQCSSQILICALCGGSHSANSTLCPILAAEMARVRNAILITDRTDRFWPVKRAVQKRSRTPFPQPSITDGLSTGVQNTDLSDEETGSQSKPIWPAARQSWDKPTSRISAMFRLKSGSPEPPWSPAGREKPATKALEAVSGKQPEAEPRPKPRPINEISSTEQQDREELNTTRGPSSPEKPTAAQAIGSWSAFASGDVDLYKLDPFGSLRNGIQNHFMPQSSSSPTVPNPDMAAVSV